MKFKNAITQQEIRYSFKKSYSCKFHSQDFSICEDTVISATKAGQITRATTLKLELLVIGSNFPSVLCHNTLIMKQGGVYVIRKNPKRVEMSVTGNPIQKMNISQRIDTIKGLQGREKEREKGERRKEKRRRRRGEERRRRTGSWRQKHRQRLYLAYFSLTEGLRVFCKQKTKKQSPKLSV